MAEFPALQLWTDAYISDTQHLTNEEHGVYLRLLMFAWRTTTCSLPDDDKRLARMVGIGMKKWLSIKGCVMAFWDLSDGEWTQKRLSKERKFVQKSRDQKRFAGEASARAKALKSKDTSSTAVDLPLQRLVNNPYPYPQPDKNISSSLRSEDKRKASKSGNGMSEFRAEISSILDDERIEAICVARKKKGAAFTSHAGRLLNAALQSCPDVNAAADEMILRNWTSVKPEWLLKDRHVNGQSNETAFAKNQRTFTEALEKQVYGVKKNDREFTSSSTDITLGSGDFRSYRETQKSVI